MRQDARSISLLLHHDLFSDFLVNAVETLETVKRKKKSHRTCQNMPMAYLLEFENMRVLTKKGLRSANSVRREGYRSANIQECKYNSSLQAEE